MYQEIGNGEKISFWTQKWVPYNSDFFIREPRGPLSNVSKFSDFIVNGEWDYLKLQLHLLPREANFVSQIPISNTGVEDRLVWHYDNKGNYSVRSGYRQALVLKEKEIDHASSSSNPTGEFWKQIWRLNVIPKIRLFLWKACLNALATRDRLFRQNCVSSPLCPICRTNPETIEHLLLECERTKPIWFCSSLGLRLDGILGNISDRINSLLSHIKTGSSRTKFLSTFASVAWSIWKARNRFIFEQSVLCPAQVILEAQVNDSDFEKAHSFDPASDFSTLRSGIVARNSAGSLLPCFGNKWRCESALAAELLAIRTACVFAASKGWFNAIIETDSQSAIKLATSENVQPWTLSALIKDIRYWISDMNLDLVWTSRRCNGVAHHVAKVAFSSPVSFMWESYFPVEITSIARSDLA